MQVVRASHFLELPVQAPVKLDLVINPKTATALGLTTAALIKEVETVIAKADQMYGQLESPDPGASDQAMMSIIAANGLRALLPKLQARCEQVREREQAAAWLAEQEAAWLTRYDSLRDERDAPAEERREVYGDAANKIVDVFGRIDANNKDLAELHRDRPAGMEQHLRSAELDARGLASFTYSTPSLLASVVLFDWDSGRQIWPLPRPSMAAAFAAAVPVYDRRCTANWAQDNERRVAAQQAERQRMADYYARLTREQDERQNREERERFAEAQRRRLGGS